MNRPIGVILASIVLSLFALCQLIAAALMTIGGFAMGHPSATASPVPVPDWMHWIVLLMAAFVIALATWTIFTVVGILRLRNWGRISILVIAGCAAVIALFGLFGLVMMSAIMHTMPTTQPQPPPFMMHLVLIFSAVLYGIILAIAVWWLVYFNLRSIKAAFMPPILLPDGTLLPYAAPPRAPGYFPPAPTAITILGWFMLVGALCCLLLMLLPFPAFFLGFILTGLAKYLLYLTFAALAAYSGWGLLHLRESGRRVAIAYLCLGIVQMPLLLTPWFRHRQEAYMQAYMQAFQKMVPAPLPPGVQPTETYLVVGGPHYMAFMAITIGLVLIFNGFLLWLLHRHRDAFRDSPIVHTSPAP